MYILVCVLRRYWGSTRETAKYMSKVSIVPILTLSVRPVIR